MCPENRPENLRPFGTIARLAATTRAGNLPILPALPLVLSVDLAAIHEYRGNRRLSTLVMGGEGRRDGEANGSRKGERTQ